MTPAEFKEIRAKAVALFNSQPASDKQKVSLDTVFMALAAQGYGRAKVRKKGDEPIPDWFTDTLDKLRGSGEKLTVSRFMLLAGKFPSTRSDQLSVGEWLRKAGYTPRKTGGNLIFEL